MKLAVGFRNGIGNFIIFTSILRSLSHFSGTTVDLVLDERWEGEQREAVNNIASNLSCIERTVNFPSEFKPSSYEDIYMSFHSVYEDAFFEYVHGKERVNPVHLTAWGGSFLHERDFYYQEIFNQFNYVGKIFPQEMPKSPSFHIERRKTNRICISNGRLVVNGNIWDKKRYPFWFDVIERLLGFYDAEIFLLGGKTDKEWGDEIVQRINNENCQSLCGNLSILETASIIDSSNLVLSNDTSIFHIADALNIPGVVLFGPTLISKNGPLNNSIIPIRSSRSCSPCQGTAFFSMCADAQCMEEISSSLILAACRQFNLS